MTDEQMTGALVFIIWLILRICWVLWARMMARTRYRRPWVWGWSAVIFGWLPLLVLLFWGKRRMPTAEAIP